MAAVTKAGAVPISGQGDYATFTWELTTADHTGDAVTGYEDYADMTVQVFGTFGGATVSLEGSLDGGTTWATLTDPQGNAIAKTTAGIEAVAEAVPRFRAKLTTVGVGATITAIVYARKAK